MTEPPQSAFAGGSCSDWAIHSAYMAHQARQLLEGEQAKAKTAAARKGASSSAAEDDAQAASGHMAQVWELLCHRRGGQGPRSLPAIEQCLGQLCC